MEKGANMIIIMIIILMNIGNSGNCDKSNN